MSILGQKNKEKPKAFVEIRVFEPVIAERAWTWLQEKAPQYAEALEKAVEQGFTPEQIYQYFMRKLANHVFAMQLREAANYLISFSEESE